MPDTGEVKTIPRTAVVVCGTICVLAILGTFLLMELNGKNTGSLLPLIMGIITAAGSTAAWSNSKDAKKDANEIKKQTNGPLTDGLDRIVLIEEKLNDMDQRLRDKGL